MQGFFPASSTTPSHFFFFFFPPATTTTVFYPSPSSLLLTIRGGPASFFVCFFFLGWGRFAMRETRAAKVQTWHDNPAMFLGEPVPHTRTNLPSHQHRRYLPPALAERDWMLSSNNSLLRDLWLICACPLVLSRCLREWHSWKTRRLFWHIKSENSPDIAWRIPKSGMLMKFGGVGVGGGKPN